jgi:N-formylglutamate amidohydrolase
MQVTLTSHAEDLLRDALARHPGQSPAQILEEALVERVERETAAKRVKPKRTREEFDAWVRQFAAYSDKIPSLSGETFSRAMIYQDHN